MTNVITQSREAENTAFTQRRLVFFRPSADGCQPLTTGESNLLCISEHAHTQHRYIYTTRLGSYDETSQSGEAVK